MTLLSVRNSLVGALIAVLLVSCGGASQTTSANNSPELRDLDTDEIRNRQSGPPTPTSFWDVFRGNNVEQTVSVNRYLWNATLDVLEFLPVESVDPFTGVIVTGYGTPPGGSRAYRATILIDDPALDARSLNVALQTRNGPASAQTQRAVENAILSRARQLRIADDKL